MCPIFRHVGSACVWIGIFIIPIRIRIGSTMESRIWIWIGINTMLIHNTRTYGTDLSPRFPILCSVYIPVVRSHAAVDHADVVGDLFNLAGGLILEQDGLVLLLSGQHHSVHSLEKRQ
jgi:hypothetical protein